jgi:hypothetical protein
VLRRSKDEVDRSAAMLRSSFHVSPVTSTCAAYAQKRVFFLAFHSEKPNNRMTFPEDKVKQSENIQWRRKRGEEVGYSSYSLLTSALDEDEWSRPGCALPPGKGPPVPIVQEAGWPQSRSGHRG